MSDYLQQAILAKQMGKNALARQLLAQALIQNSKNEQAWLLMADLVEDVRLRRSCLERALAINPRNAETGLALTRLNTSPLGPVQRGERDKLSNPFKFEKTPPFTPPFTWGDGQEELLALGDLTFPEGPSEEEQKPVEAAPTFDWAHESDEPDKTIDRIFDAVSSPELATQPLPGSEDWISADEAAQGETGFEQREQQTEDHWLNELVGDAEQSQPAPAPAPLNPEDFAVDAEPQLGMAAFSPLDEPGELVSADHLLWDNPNARADRLVMLSDKSLVVANPQASDIPHILGLFAERRMLRDLLGDNARMIKLETVNRVSFDPKKPEITISYLNNKEKTSLQKLSFLNLQMRDEALIAFKLRLGATFMERVQRFPMGDKLVPPIVCLLLLAFIGWGLLAGVPLLSGLPDAQAGSWQPILAAVERFVDNLGAFNLVLILVLLAVLVVVWMVLNLTRPAMRVSYERH